MTSKILGRPAEAGAGPVWASAETAPINGEAAAARAVCLRKLRRVDWRAGNGDDVALVFMPMGKLSRGKGE